MGTHPIFESDFDCLTEVKSAISVLTVFLSVGTKAIEEMSGGYTDDEDYADNTGSGDYIYANGGYSTASDLTSMPPIIVPSIIPSLSLNNKSSGRPEEVDESDDDIAAADMNPLILYALIGTGCLLLISGIIFFICYRCKSKRNDRDDVFQKGRLVP